MSPIRVLGLLALVVGVVLQPIGWMYTHWVTTASFIAIAVGVFLLLIGREGQLAAGVGSDPRTAGREMPGDIYGHSGQMSGGRSTSWQSHQSSGEASDGD